MIDVIKRDPYSMSSGGGERRSHSLVGSYLFKKRLVT